MPVLVWDAETRSVADLRKVGLRRYMEHPTTQHILSRFSFDGGDQFEVRFDQPLPRDIWDAFLDPSVQVLAHNHAFERQLLQQVLQPRYGWPVCPPQHRWDCTMAQARACGLPGTLEGALAALKLPVQKDKVGHALMMRMCRPRLVAPDDGCGGNLDGRTYTRWDGSIITWWADDERLARLAAYCGDDVKGTWELHKRLPKLTPAERETWILTEQINERGVRFDLPFVRRAKTVADEARTALDAEMRAVTRGKVPKASNVAALKVWLLEQGVQIAPDDEDDEGDDDEDDLPDLRRRDVQRLVLDPRVTGAAKRALQIRLEAGKSSVKKLDAILERADEHGIVRDLLAYHGASTGRYSAAGSGVQVQNFIRDVIDNWDDARDALDQGFSLFEVVHGPTLDTISRMLRGAIIPHGEGDEIMSVDYAAVELRGVAWLAHQNDLVEDLRTGAKIYEKVAGWIYEVPPETVKKDSRERWVGKQTTLGCGYQMGWRRFLAQCLQYGVVVEQELAERSVTTFREAFPRIPALWYMLNDAAIEAVATPKREVLTAGGRIMFRSTGPWLGMKLPSGRWLLYREPKIEVDEQFGREGVTFWGVDSKTKRWSKRRGFGGFWTENAVQAICRDLMVLGMKRLQAARYPIITTVHDEIVALRRNGHGSVPEMVRLMCELPDWAKGFPLSAEGWQGPRYG